MTTTVSLHRPGLGVSEDPAMRRAPAAAASTLVEDCAADRRTQYEATRCATLSCDPNRAYISLAASPPAAARRMAEPSTAPHPTTRGAGGDLAAATPASRSFVLASLRALHLDPRAPPPAQQQPRPEPPVRRGQTPTHPPSTDTLDKPFHISLRRRRPLRFRRLLLAPLEQSVLARHGAALRRQQRGSMCIDDLCGVDAGRAIGLRETNPREHRSHVDTLIQSI